MYDWILKKLELQNATYSGCCLASPSSVDFEVDWIVVELQL